MAACLLLSAYFSATETAFSSANSTRLKTLAEKGNKNAALACRLLGQYDKLLSTILIGNNIVNILMASIGTVLFVRHYGDAGATISTVVVTVVVLIFGEISPKSIAKDCAERFAMRSAPILQVFLYILTPLNFLFSLWKKLLAKVFRLNAESKMSQEELLMLVDEVQQDGSIDKNEGELLKNAIDFSEQQAKDILIHRVDLAALPITASKEEIAALFDETKYSRLLIYQDSIDHILGTVLQKDFYVGCGITKKPIRDILVPPVFVLENEPISRLLKTLQKAKTHVAVVVDEYGGTCGIVTMEDILEDISERLCQGCLNCRHCWEHHGDETRQGMADILWQMEQQGEASVWQENQDFASRCMRLEEYKELARQEMAHARQRIGWQNQLARNREIMARQMLEVAQALSGFTTRLGDGQPLQRGVLNQLKKRLELYGIHIEKVWGVKKNNKIEVAFTGHCGKNQCLTKTDVAAVLSEELGAKLTPARETRNVLSRESQTMYFRQDTCYKGLTAVARVSRWDQQVSGDNYSFLELESGELLMVLADGMGYGGEAERDSGSLIETLEHLLEAGFEKQTAWRLLNTLLVAEYEGESFTTLDMVSVDLYTGWCQFIKSGAAAAYLYRDGQVEAIEAQSLPVGVSVDTGCDVVKRQLKPGDMVILVSDGVPDGYEKDMTEMIREVAGPNAQEFANQILIHALAGASQEAADDMTVLVLGFWNKN